MTPRPSVVSTSSFSTNSLLWRKSFKLKVNTGSSACIPDLAIAALLLRFLLLVLFTICLKKKKTMGCVEEETKTPAAWRLSPSTWVLSVGNKETSTWRESLSVGKERTSFLVSRPPRGYLASETKNHLPGVGG